MYKLVIVEDERDARNRLVNLIERTEHQFELVAAYENGIDAYDGISLDCPDLVITDIRMPYISGIELVKRIREVLPLVKIAIVTGYSEFDYAKEAANLGVIGFVSKPITREDVEAVLRKASELLDEEFLTATNLTKLEGFYRSSLPIIREHDLSMLCNLSEVSPTLQKRLRHNQIDLDFRYLALCVFDFDEASDWTAEHYETGFSSVRRLVEESIAPLCGVELFHRDEKLCMILKSHTPIDVARVENLLETILLRTGRFSGVPLSVGMSNLCEDCTDFARMLREALRALEYRKAMGGNKVFLFGNSVPAPSGRLPVEESDAKQLTYLMRCKSAEECDAFLATLRRRLEGEESRNAYDFALTSLLNTLLRVCDDLEGLYARYADRGSLYRRAFESKTADEAFAYVSELARVIRQLNDNIIVGNVESNLQRVLTYMETHYQEPDISFESMAREVGFSVSYISALLKKNRNTSFVKHLTMLRMERAKELLENPALKIIDIAERLGYTDPYYFSHCFKKYTGLSPKEYRSHE